MDMNQHQERLTSVPNYFNIDINDLTAGKIKVIQQKLEDEEAETTSVNDKIMRTNLFSYILVLFGRYTECESQNEIVLQENPSNINANIIKYRLCFLNGEITKAESYWEQIKSCHADDYLRSEAYAEMAYAYYRFGGRYNKKAITIFSDVIEKYPQIYEWKYRLALTIRRCLDKNLIHVISNDMDKYFPICFNLLNDIIDNTENIYLKASSYVQMACLLNSTDSVLKAHGIDVSLRYQSIMDHLDKATDLSPLNAWVLQEAGRCLRNIRQFKAATIILEKAINIRPTATSYHHLAKCLIQLEGYSPNVIYSLERSVELDARHPSKFDLGTAYMQQETPDFTKALECFESYKPLEFTNERSGVAACCSSIAQCYFNMAQISGIKHDDCKAYMEKGEENCRRSAIEAALMYLGTFVTGTKAMKKLKILELFPNDKPPNGFSPRDKLIGYVFNNINQKCNFMLEVKHACLSGRINGRNKQIQNYLQHDQLSECLDMIILTMTTDLHDFECTAIKTIADIVYKSVLQSRQEIARNCVSWTSRCFYDLEQLDYHVRIIHDDNSETEADRLEDIMIGLDMKVVRNQLDILFGMNREKALLSVMSKNIVVFYIVKGNNTDLLGEYPVLRQLPANKPVLVPITVDNSTVPSVFTSHSAMDYPDINFSLEQKAIWYKTFFERIFDTFKSTTAASATTKQAKSSK